MFNLKKYVKPCGKSFAKYAGVLICLVLLYIFLLFLVFLIPDKCISDNVNASIDDLTREGTWPQIFFFQGYSKPENQGEKLVYRSMLSENLRYDSALKNAMDVADYARFWHGYLVIMKPLTALLQYTQIRYISMLLFFMLTYILLNRIREKIGIDFSYWFLFVFLMAYSFMVPMTIQYATSYYIFIGFSIIILNNYDKPDFHKRLGMLFFVAGSLDNFLEWYTTPLLTLGMPMLFLCMLWIKNGYPDKKQLAMFIGLSLLWAAGYSFTWISKWIVASVILNRNILREVTSRANTYSEFAVDHSVESLGLSSVLICINNNLKGWWHIFVKGQQGVYLLTEVMLSAFLVLYKKYLKGHNFDKEKCIEALKECMSLLLTALYPFVWCVVDTGHTMWHSWWCFRLFMITFAALGFAVIYIYKKGVITLG